MKTIRLPDELSEQVDRVRGDVPRDRWVRRALESVLGNNGAGQKDDLVRDAARPQGDARQPAGESGSATEGSGSTAPASTRTPGLGIRQNQTAQVPLQECPVCGKHNGVHRGDCQFHPRNGRA